jgi:3-hydroxyacyl-CoA dehydrogenase/enoyl-CoA hydratase/3-hydroxybutyryl-CoA epimerase
MNNGAYDTMRDKFDSSIVDVEPALRQREEESSAQFGALNQITFLESSIAHIRLGSVGDRTVLLTEERLENLSQLLQRALNLKAKGIIISGPSDDMFAAGADVGAIERIQRQQEGQELSSLGQAIFDQIERCPVPVVAAISGPCLGGGLELALACSARIATDRPSTKIGLPEVKLGIIPGFGGTQRLPRLIGLPRAIKMILSGSIITPNEALRLGILKQIVPPTALIRTAEALILEGVARRSRISLLDRIITFTSIGRNFVRRRSEEELGGMERFYPAPLKALSALMVGLERGVEEGLRAEARSIGELVVTPECKSLVKLFFLTESSKNIGKSARRSLEGLHAVVLGAQGVGSELAVDLARREFPVILRDRSPEVLTQVMGEIRQTVSGLKRVSAADRSFIINRINPTNGNPAAIAGAQVVIDTTPEIENRSDSVTQQPAGEWSLAQIADTVQPTALIVMTAVASSVAQKSAGLSHPERCLGMNLYPRMNGSQLIEIVRSPQTNYKSLALAAALTTAMGRYPVIVDDTPGAIVQRILAPFILAALRLLREGHPIESIDAAAVNFGLPVGPFQYIDNQGLGSVIALLTKLEAAYGERMAGVDILKALRDGGRPTAPRQGSFFVGAFYEHSATGRVACSAVRDILRLQQTTEQLSATALLPLLIYPIVNEAIRCLDEGVAGTPGIEAGFQIDLASVFGCGFPPFLGGILHYADRVGPKTILHHLHNAERAFGPLFKPTKGLAQRSASGRSVYDPCS